VPDLPRKRLIVENMRRGMHRKDAGLEALEHVRAIVVEKRLRKENGDRDFHIAYCILNARNEHAGAAIYGDDESTMCRAGIKDTNERFCVRDENGRRMALSEGLTEGKPQE
jgi:hypothetical protein